MEKIRLMHVTAIATLSLIRSTQGADHAILSPPERNVREHHAIFYNECECSGTDPHRSTIAVYRAPRQKRDRELGGHADSARHDQRARRRQWTQDRVRP